MSDETRDLERKVDFLEGKVDHLEDDIRDLRRRLEQAESSASSAIRDHVNDYHSSEV